MKISVRIIAAVAALVAWFGLPAPTGRKLDGGVSA